MTKPRLFLHVGMHKTGTSTAQAYLQNNEQELLEAGYWLPSRLGREDGGFQRVAKLITTSGPEAFVDHVMKEANGRKIIVSAENLCNILPIYAAGASEMIADTFDTTILMLLRRQDQMLESAFAQVVKYGRKLNIERDIPYRMNYLPAVTHFVDRFGLDNVKVDIMGREGFPSTEQWVSRAIGAPEFSPVSSRVNVRIHRRGVLFSSSYSPPNRRAGRAMHKILLENDFVENDGIKYLSSVGRREDIVARNRKTNTRICKMFDLDEDYFNQPVVDSNWFPAREISEQEAKAVFDKMEEAGSDFVPLK